MSIVTFGVDLGKTVCSLVGLDAAGTVVMRKRLRRAGWVAFVLIGPPKRQPSNEGVSRVRNKSLRLKGPMHLLPTR
jgi:hypothetical protein